ncbi:MAG: hypothetical protein ALAOOOJD_01133 [bacterium]|nr:hypothetical protein [bacterium]
MNQSMTLAWVKVGGWCGLLGIVSYLLAAFAPLPDTLGFAAAFAFGPLLAISAMGLYHGLAAHRNSPSLQIATVFAIGGGITVLIMLTTQQAIFEIMRTTLEKADQPAVKEQWQKIRDGLNAVHLGIDVAWDVLIATATILFGYHMLKHPAFGKMIGGLGMLFGTLLIVFNLNYFPVPPADANSIDWGPFVALWFVAVFVLLLRSVGWVREKTL